ncbi:hypothetical protein [Nostoc sp. 'Peltigera membranacea cyanobiont' N6]|uniref:hypothetical protein n=1 Tax=Nostoc sp. 'Peltigera membranacea cyanobiont' N6 TaxID=1261031 RepID=UPI000CF3346B|nr:hypothetical protein [Nostoc sp. 'Peltigera membranacea cyanobiont' N6]AVH63665.1 hypothetical protein NPM_1880 [Nostoc sp. 'Peltigera membranacea cyanobiont' N6]
MADTTMLDNRINKQIKFEPLEAIVAATEEESVILAEKLTQVAIPLSVLLQALNIAKHDKAAAFRYADNYLKNTRKSKWVIMKAA